ncbi:MAG: NTP transferase domain-containing protein, partial [Burkholderiales bacterium]
MLAAGRGRRFDKHGERDKLLARIDGHARVERAVRALAGSCDRVIVVVRDDAAGDRVRAAVGAAGPEFVGCPQADDGMGHSLACGARAALDGPKPAAVLVLPGDMPFVQPDTVASVLAAL